MAWPQKTSTGPRLCMYLLYKVNKGERVGESCRLAGSVIVIIATKTCIANPMSVKTV